MLYQLFTFISSQENPQVSLRGISNFFQTRCLIPNSFSSILIIIINARCSVWVYPKTNTMQQILVFDVSHYITLLLCWQVHLSLFFFFVIANTTSTFMIYTMEYNIAAFCHLHYPLLSVKSSIMLSSVNKFVLLIHNISVYREIWFPAASFVFIQTQSNMTFVGLIQYKNE